MKKVYLIRHGLPDFPGGQRMCIGTTDIPMGEAGLAQAAAMARKLPPVTAVFSSPLTRAVQTAEAIGPDITILPGLREIHAGEWDGLTFREIRAEQVLSRDGETATVLAVAYHQDVVTEEPYTVEYHLPMVWEDGQWKAADIQPVQ